MKQVGISGDELEWRREREASEYARKLWASGELDDGPQESVLIEEPSITTRIRRWFFTPRGAMVYFGIGYGVVAIWFIWMLS